MSNHEHQLYQKSPVLNLVITGQLKPGHLPKFVELFKPLAEYVTREEPGTLSYQLAIADEPDTIMIFERYISAEYLETVHWQSKPYQDFRAAVAAAGIEWVRKEGKRYYDTDVGYMQRSAPASS